MKKLMIKALQGTIEYRSGTVKYEEDAVGGIIIFGERPTFSSPAIAAMFEAMGLKTYCDYDAENDRVFLRVFSYGN